MGNILPNSDSVGHWIDGPQLTEGLVWENHLNGTCGAGIRRSCCIGAISHGGSQGWRGHCTLGNDHLQHRWSTNEHIYTYDDLDNVPRHLVFIGDSVMNQMFDSMICYFDPGTNIKPHVVETRGGNWRYGVRTNITVTLGDTLMFTMLKSYRQREGDDTLQRVCADKTVTAIVYNIGLHYNKMGTEPQMLVENARWFAREFLGNCGNHVTLIIRETTPQHFNNSDTGEWNKKQTGCVPIRNETRWRHELLVDTLGEYSGLNFTVVPVWDIMKSRYDLHMSSECTHYCYTPTLWDPIINRVIAKIIVPLSK